MKKLFDIGIGKDETTEQYFAIANSLTDKKSAVFKGKSMRLVLAKMSKRLREKTQETKNFPITEPSRIITLNGKGDPKLIVPARN